MLRVRLKVEDLALAATSTAKAQTWLQSQTEPKTMFRVREKFEDLAMGGISTAKLQSEEKSVGDTSKS
jgi:hypothetical protein